MIDIKVMGDTTCIYKHRFLQYLQKVADGLEKKYNYQLNATIKLLRPNNRNMLDIQICLYDNFIKIDLNGENAEVVKLNRTNRPNFIDTIDIDDISIAIFGPIGIELIIIMNLLRLIYVIRPDDESIDIYKKCDNIIQPWVFKNSYAAYISSKKDVHFLDMLRDTLQCYTEPIFAEQITHLAKSSYLCYANDSKAKMVEITSSDAIDMILERYETESDMPFDGLESFNITVQQKDDIAKLIMDIELNKDIYDKLSNVSFTANYSNNFNNPIQIPDPSYAIAHLLINFFIYYMKAIEETTDGNFNEALINFKDIIMQILPVEI